MKLSKNKKNIFREKPLHTIVSKIMYRKDSSKGAGYHDGPNRPLFTSAARNIASFQLAASRITFWPLNPSLMCAFLRAWLGKKDEATDGFAQDFTNTWIKRCNEWRCHGKCMVSVLEKQVSHEFSSLKFLGIREMLKIVCVWNRIPIEQENRNKTVLRNIGTNRGGGRSRRQKYTQWTKNLF